MRAGAVLLLRGTEPLAVPGQAELEAVWGRLSGGGCPGEAASQVPNTDGKTRVNFPAPAQLGRQRHSFPSQDFQQHLPRPRSRTSQKASLPQEFDAPTASPGHVLIPHMCHFSISADCCGKRPRPDAFVMASIFCSSLFCFIAGRSRDRARHDTPSTKAPLAPPPAASPLGLSRVIWP